MNKKLFILPLLAMALIGCGEGGGGGQGGGGGGDNPPTPGTRDGLTIDTAFTAAEAVAKMKAAGEGKIVDNKEYFVTGVFDTGTTVNAQYHQWYGNSGEFKVSGATNDSGTSVSEADGKLDGATFVVKGYMELYNGECKVGYLPASASPTGQKYVPSLVKLSNVSGGGGGDTPTPTPSGSSDGIAGKNASKTGSKTDKKVTFDLSTGTISGISATSSGSPDKSGTATVNGTQFAYANVCAHAASDYIQNGYLGLCAKGAKANAFFANKTAMPGNIKAVEFTMPTEKSSGSVSALAPFIIDFGTSAINGTTLTGGQTGGSGQTLIAYTASGVSATYFSITCVQGKSGKGEATWYNGYISQIVVYYE